MRLWNPTAVVDACKTSLGILIAWGIVLWLQWPEPFMAPLAVLVLQTPYLGASLRKGLMRVLGTLAGAGLVLALIGLFVQERWTLLSLVSLVLMLSVYQMRLSRYGYAWFMVALAVSVIAADASSAPDQAFQAAVYRTSEAIVGILVVLVINGILWPRTAGRSYRDKQRGALQELAEHLRRTGAAATEAATTAAPTAGGFAPMPKTLLRAPPELRELLAAAELDTNRFRRLRQTHEAQIQALTATLGSVMGLSENLRLAAAGRRAFLTPAQRQVLREALEQLASAIDAASAPVSSSVSGSPATAATPTAAPTTAAAADPPDINAAIDAALAEVEARRQRLLTGPSLARQTAGDSALAHALTAQLEALSANVQRLAEASAALGTGRTLPMHDLPPEPRVPWRARFELAFPNALAMGLSFWLLVPIWVGLQWPPDGLLAVVMALVLIGGHTLQKTSALQPAMLTLLGFLLGIISTAPIYLLLLPRLDGFLALVLVLFPVYFAITYFLHALQPPYQLTALRVGILAIMLLNLEPQQTYDALGYFNTALTFATGLLIAVAALAMVRDSTPQEQLRRRIKRLLSQLSSAQQGLANLKAPGIAAAVSRYDQQLRAELQGLTELLSSAYSPQVPGNDGERIQALGDALRGLVTRFRGLQQARLRWGIGMRRQGLGTSLGRQLLQPFFSTFEAFRDKLDHPTKAASVAALDAITDEVRAELSRIDSYRRSEQVNPDNVYILTIAGHYVAVMHALRELAAALDDIDWAAWRAQRF